MHTRCSNDLIIITILPHLLSIYYTYIDPIYTSIIISSSISSYLWHHNREPQNHLLLIDYFFAGLLSYYEVSNMYNCNKDWFYFSIYINLYVLTFNKIIYLLALQNIINYSKWHSIYHLLSSGKTLFLSHISYKSLGH